MSEPQVSDLPEPATPLARAARNAIYLLIMIATFLLAVGEPAYWLPLVTLTAIVASHYLTDERRIFCLPQQAADGLALGIMVVSAILAIRGDRSGLLVIVANLQSYLQYVLMFQPKTPRIYWQLVLLSLGQMAIASTLVPGPLFGFALLLYVLVGIVTFGLLLVERESAAVQSRPAADGELMFSGSMAPLAPRDLMRQLLPSAGLITLLTLVGTCFLFLALPRWNVERLESLSTEPIQTVGFSKMVTLGELGETVNNPDTVMRIQFFRGRRPLRLVGEPLYRGTVVTRYRNHVWTQPHGSLDEPLPTDAGSTITLQRITIEPLDVSEVFCVTPAVAVGEPNQQLKVDQLNGEVNRTEDSRDLVQEFDIGTTGIRGDRQRTILPSRKSPNPLQLRLLLQPFRAGAENPEFQGLKTLATQILSEAGISPQDRVAAARALSDYFHRSGEFFYSLEPQQRDPILDPLEDFVTLHKSGHCEYYAGALTLMLRSQGIPARMVIGFKGGEWNQLGGYYQVQQLHAHAWVEAYLETQHFPPGEFAGERQPDCAWLVLDPTDGIQEDGGSIGSSFVARMRQSIDYARVLWINYVASLNAKRQKQGIYEPLAAGIEAGVENMTSVEGWQGRLRTLEESRAGKFWGWYRRHWFSWRGGLVAIGFSLGIVALFLAARKLLGVARRRWWGRNQALPIAPVLEMYRRLEESLARVGLIRSASQTAYEFALAAGGELAERVEHRGVSHLPRRIIDSFYRVRFGGVPLDKQEAQAVEQALAELERVLSPAR